MIPRQLLHWDDDAVVIYGGTPARRNEPPKRVTGTSGRWCSLDEVERVRLVEPFPSIEITYRFERVRQRETVRPTRPSLVDPFADVVRDFARK